MRRIALGLLAAWVLWAEVRIGRDNEIRAVDSYETRIECEADMGRRRDQFVRDFQSTTSYKMPGWYVREIGERRVWLEQPGTRQEAFIVFTCLPPGTSPRG